MASHYPMEDEVFSIREQPIDYACWLGSLAQSVECKHTKLSVMGSSPAGVHFVFHSKKKINPSRPTGGLLPWPPPLPLTFLSFLHLTHLSLHLFHVSIFSSISLFLLTFLLLSLPSPPPSLLPPLPLSLFP